MAEPAVRSVRPDPGEYDAFYASYVARVPDGDVVEVLRRQGEEAAALLEGLPPERHDFRYAEGKWTLKEVVGHVVDVERVFAHRAMCFARGDRNPLPGMDQDLFVAGAAFGSRPLSSLIAEHRHQRAANAALFESFDERILERRGTASGCDFTVRALLYVIAGHELHHLAVLRERYL